MKKTIQLYGFPYLVEAEVVKNFVEQRTGKDTVVAIEVKQSKTGSRSYAKVQFTDSIYCERIINVANSYTKLYFGSSYLKAYVSDMDIVQNPRSFLHELESVTLCFGCQTSKDDFSVLWRTSNVAVKFGHGMKKMHFFFSHESVEYRLQLSYESIWQIVMHSPRGQHAKILLIQLFGAPRIYKKVNYSNVFSFYMETQDDQWVRTTDFTQSCIGQSSGICLVLRHGTKLPDFRDNFVYYKETENSLNLESCAPYSQKLDLVPILHPPRGHELPYKILFKVCGLVQTGCIPGPKLDKTFFQLVNPQKIDLRYIEHALEKLYFLKECCYDPVKWLLEQYKRYIDSKEQPKSPSIHLDEGLLYVHRVQVTPSRVYFSGPEVNVSNRVLRHYKQHIDNFLRVSFVDEEWEKLYSTDLSPRLAGYENRRTKIYERVLSILREGIEIGDKRFEFLAFSSSQLRENSLWMFAPIDGVDADRIRSWMGDFRSIRNVAKYAARLGQSFGSSTETLTVAEHEMQRIPDIATVSDGVKYVFSDGIGKISASFAERIAVKCGIRGSVPSAFQIRFRGYKGVVAVDLNPHLSKKLWLRPSMLKYESDNPKLDVLAWSKYQPCYLNRQIITLLSTLGVRDDVFEKKQREAVAQLDQILVDPSKAQEALTLMSPGENTYILKELLNCGYKPDEEPFLSMMLKAFRASKLLDLRTKARVFVPKGQQMMGCLDETGTLEYGQVFVQYSSAARRSFLEDRDISYTSDDYNYLIQGRVVVAKNPCLHPGDVRVLTAVDVEALHHMVDCIVFPSKGKRPHPNECSGSDLDGDIYFVCWDSDLIPSKQASPMNYNPAPTAELENDVTIDEVREYFTNYIVNDSLGIIANAHTVFADKEPLMALSQPCLELAALFSTAVDFPTTGVPADIPPHLRVREYPDFMEKPDRPTYTSARVIGKLFRQVKDIAPHSASFRSFTAEVARSCYDREMEVEGFEDYLDEAFEYKTEYDYKLGNLMDYYGVRTEAEMLSGGIMKTSKTFDRRKDAEAIGVAVRSLRNEARSWFKRGEDSYAMASAWYHVTYHPSYWGLYNVGLKRDHFISFPWCVYDKLVQIKKSSRRRAANASMLERRLARQLNL